MEVSNAEDALPINNTRPKLIAVNATAVILEKALENVRKLTQLSPLLSILEQIPGILWMVVVDFFRIVSKWQPSSKVTIMFLLLFKLQLQCSRITKAQSQVSSK